MIPKTQLNTSKVKCNINYPVIIVNNKNIFLYEDLSGYIILPTPENKINKAIQLEKADMHNVWININNYPHYSAKQWEMKPVKKKISLH